MPFPLSTLALLLLCAPSPIGSGSVPGPPRSASTAEYFALLQAPDHPAGRQRVAISPLLAEADPFVRAVGALRRTRIESAEGALFLESEYVFQETSLRVVHTEERRPPTESVSERLLWRELLGQRSRTLRAEIEFDSPDSLRIVDSARGDTWHSKAPIPTEFAFPELWLEDLLSGVHPGEPRLFEPTTRECLAVEVAVARVPGPAPLWALTQQGAGGSRSARLFCGRAQLASWAGPDAPLAVRVGRDRYDVLRRRALGDLRQEAADEARASEAPPLASADARRRP